jgi:GR25 family glycosyltransferase involved in LPS biosynthesis
MQSIHDEPGFIAAALADQRERRASFARNFSDPSHFRILDSIDGRTWSDDVADRHVSQEVRELRQREREKGKKWFNPSAVACALSHRDVLLAEAEKRDLILCEDDVRIESKFIGNWCDDEVRKIFMGLDGVVLLHYFSRQPIRPLGAEISRFGKYRIYEVDARGIRSAACYYANPHVARSIRNYQNPVSSTADHWEKMIEAGAFRHVYVVSPPPCTIGGFSSTIGYTEGDAKFGNAIWFRLARRFRRLMARRGNKIYETVSESFER